METSPINQQIQADAKGLITAILSLHWIRFFASRHQASITISV